jgi:RNA polymerase sigma-70 factor, ECF subfamily
MYRVTSSVCLTELKRSGRRKETPLESWHEGGTEEPDHAEQRDRAALIRRCVDRLPERYATIVRMYYLEELPYEEVAAAMEIPVGTLKTWMFRARKELRVIVESELGDTHGLAI